MAQALNLYLDVSHISPVAMDDLGADSEFANHNPGTISMMTSRFGPVMYKYTRDQQGGMSKGEMASAVSAVTGTVTAESGESNSTTSLSDTTNFTAIDEEGKMCMITDNNDVAGAAPEGEVAVVIKNTATVLTFDGDYPLSAAPAVSDTYRNTTFFHMEDSADGDFAYQVLGVVMQDRTTDFYGWVQFYGYNPGALYTTAAVTALNPVVCDTAAVDAHGCDTQELWVGRAPNTVAADLASPFRSIIYVDLLTTVHAIAHA